MISTVTNTIDRIKDAHPDSPVAVFLAPGDGAGLRSVFANTVMTQQEIMSSSDVYIGTFCRDDDPAEVKAELTRAMRRAANFRHVQ